MRARSALLLYVVCIAFLETGVGEDEDSKVANAKKESESGKPATTGNPTIESKENPEKGLFWKIGNLVGKISHILIPYKNTVALKKVKTKEDLGLLMPKTKSQIKSKKQKAKAVKQRQKLEDNVILDMLTKRHNKRKEKAENARKAKEKMAKNARKKAKKKKAWKAQKILENRRSEAAMKKILREKKTSRKVPREQTKEIKTKTVTGKHKPKSLQPKHVVSKHSPKHKSHTPHWKPFLSSIKSSRKKHDKISHKHHKPSSATKHNRKESPRKLEHGQKGNIPKSKNKTKGHESVKTHDKHAPIGPHINSRTDNAIHRSEVDRHICENNRAVHLPTHGVLTYTIYRNLRIKKLSPSKATDGSKYYKFRELMGADRGINEESAIEIDIGRRKRLTAVIIRPVKRTEGKFTHTGMLTAFRMKHLTIDDKWVYIHQQGIRRPKKKPRIFKVKSIGKKSNATVTVLSKPVLTASIRIYPEDWVHRPWASLSLVFCTHI